MSLVPGPASLQLTSMFRLLLGLLLVSTPLLAEVTFVRVWPGWRPAESFARIKEYFGHPEDHGRDTVLRSRPDDRAGYYFLVRTRHPGAGLTGTRFVLEIITPDSPHTRTFTFPADLPAHEHVFHLGLTGADWAGEKVKPVAWRLRLLSADDTELAASQSFLWAMPGPAAP